MGYEVEGIQTLSREIKDLEERGDAALISLGKEIEERQVAKALNRLGVKKTPENIEHNKKTKKKQRKELLRRLNEMKGIPPYYMSGIGGAKEENWLDMDISEDLWFSPSDEGIKETWLDIDPELNLYSKNQLSRYYGKKQMK